jgi:small nuclear ribonucleoprotein (snRNP)-like protein
MKFVIYLFILIALNLCPLFAQVEIETRNGEKFIGIIDSSSTDKLFLRKLQDNTTYPIDKLFVKETKQRSVSIKILSGTEYEGTLKTFNDSMFVLLTSEKNEVFIKRNEVLTLELNNPYDKSGYSMLGITAITPGGINLLFGQHFGKFGIRLQGGLLPLSRTMWGFQGNLLYNFQKSESFENNISLAFGQLNIPINKGFSPWEGTIYENGDWTYGAVCYDFNTGGFFLEVGLSFGTGYFSNPQALLQLGYVYRFVD